MDYTYILEQILFNGFWVKTIFIYLHYNDVAKLKQV